MTNSNHKLARRFLTAISRGELPDSLVTEDMTAWTLTSGDTEKSRFEAGVRMLASMFDGSLEYRIDAMTAEDDRVVVECRSRGTLNSGEDFANVHVFSFRIRDGRIAQVAEYMNPIIVNEKIVPLMQAVMAGASAKS